jgi:hypothetical protein
MRVQCVRFVCVIIMALAIWISLACEPLVVNGNELTVDELTVDDLVAYCVANEEAATGFAIQFVGVSGIASSMEDLSVELENTTGKVDGRWVKIGSRELFETRVNGNLKLDVQTDLDGTQSATVPFPGAETVLRNSVHELKLWHITTEAKVGKVGKYKATACFEPNYGMQVVGDGKYGNPVLRLLDPPFEYRHEISQNGTIFKVQSIFGDQLLVTTFDSAVNYMITKVECQGGDYSTEFGVLDTHKLPNGAYVPTFAYGLFASRDGAFPRNVHVWKAIEVDSKPNVSLLNVRTTSKYQLTIAGEQQQQLASIGPDTIVSPDNLGNLYVAAASGVRFTSGPAETSALSREGDSSEAFKWWPHLLISALVIVTVTGLCRRFVRRRSLSMLAIPLLCMTSFSQNTLADEPETLPKYRIDLVVIGVPNLRTLQVSTFAGYFKHSGFRLLESDAVQRELGITDGQSNDLNEAIKEHQNAVMNAYGQISPTIFRAKNIREQITYARPRQLIETEDAILVTLSASQCRRLSEIDQYIALRCHDALYLADLIGAEDPANDAIRNVISDKEIQLKQAAYEKSRQYWLATLDEVEEHIVDHANTRRWWQERRANFERTVYADVVCQHLKCAQFSEYIGEPIHEKDFPVIFEDVFQLELESDGRWQVKNHNVGDLRHSFWNFVGLIYQQQHGLNTNELDLSEQQCIELSQIRQRATEDSGEIDGDLSRAELEKEWQRIARKHITDGWNEILLPRQRDLITELMREQYRTMAGPLEVLFRPELDDETKEAIRKEFESCRKQLLEIEAQLMADLLSVLKKELNIPNLITGQARPKYLQPSLCLLELHLTKHGRLPQPKSEIE